MVIYKYGNKILRSGLIMIETNGYDIKNAFIEDVGKTNKYMFNKIEIYENNLEKNIFDFTTLELFEFIKETEFSSFDSLKKHISFYRKYSDWAYSEGFVNIGLNVFMLIDNMMLEKLWNEKLSKKEMKG
jgi:hypothetical protein